MILYFSGTGNCLAIARAIADATNDDVLPLTQAVRKDLTAEKRIGLVYPSYDFNVPPAVRTIVPMLRISQQAYVFIIIPCGAQAGNSSWTVRRILESKGIPVAYTHKIRVPDNSAIVFGRNPNDQNWKFTRFASRLQNIIDDIKANRHAYHYCWWSPLAWLMGTKRMEEWMIRTFRPAVNPDKCIGCGICTRVCTMRNIVLTERENSDEQQRHDNKAVAAIGTHCTACLACLHACPNQAIETGNNPTVKERQYHHPDIKTADLCL